MTDKPKPENDNRSAGIAKLNDCLHCAVNDTVLEWVRVYHPERNQELVDIILHALAVVSGKALTGVPENLRFEYTAAFISATAERAGVPIVQQIIDPPAASGTTH